MELSHYPLSTSELLTFLNSLLSVLADLLLPVHKHNDVLLRLFCFLYIKWGHAILFLFLSLWFAYSTE